MIAAKFSTHPGAEDTGGAGGSTVPTPAATPAADLTGRLLADLERAASGRPTPTPTPTPTPEGAATTSIDLSVPVDEAATPAEPAATDAAASVPFEGLPATAEETARLISSLRTQTAMDRHVIASLAERGMQDREQIANLNQALTTSRRIGAAVGIVMATYRVDEEQAFEMLSTVSHSQQRKVRDVAADIVRTRTLGP